MRTCASVRAALRRPCPLPALALASALAAWTAGSAAASLEVAVTQPDGRPVAGAVVLLHGPPGTRQAPAAAFMVDQVEQTFVPDLTVMPVGSTVTFPNSDRISHQVYSFSPAKRFQLPLYRGTPYAPVRFDAAGIVTLGCNIHDDMIAYLVVTDAAWFGRTDRDGHWHAADLPGGEFRIEVWHPRMREASALLERALTLAASGAGTMAVQLTRPLRPEPLGARPRSWSDY